MAALRGYPRSDGRKGIRNVVAVAYLVECAHHVAREIVARFRERDVHLIGFPGCYPNAYADRMMKRLCTHPNVGAVLLVSLGCESFNRRSLRGSDRGLAAGRCATLVIQETGGTRKTIADGAAWVERGAGRARDAGPRCRCAVTELVVGTVCGGSDATSGITANPGDRPRLRPARRRRARRASSRRPAS